MKNILKIIIVILVVVVLLVLFLFLQKSPLLVPEIKTPVTSDYKNITYQIEGRNIKLVDGFSEVEASPASALKLTTKYFGNESFGDVNNDNMDDVAFLLTQETGGSGTFYYLAAALKTDAGGYRSLNTIFLGDRIAPQPTRINNSVITVNYVDRKPDEPMTTTPSVGVSKSFVLENDSLVEKVPNSTLGTVNMLAVGMKVVFEDGLMVSLLEVNDSRCKPEVVCVWAGELSPTLNITGGDLGASQRQVTLGTVRTPQVTQNGYTFELKSATETTATIVVTKPINSLGGCYIGGCSSEICSDQKNIVSICLYQERYMCYKTATCERQPSGQCGWTQTSELTSCLNQYQ